MFPLQIKKHFHSDNIINSLSVAVRLEVPAASFRTCIQSLSDVYNSFVGGKLSQITCSVCLTLMTDFSFGEKLSINAK